MVIERKRKLVEDAEWQAGEDRMPRLLQSRLPWREEQTISQPGE